MSRSTGDTWHSVPSRAEHIVAAILEWDPHSGAARKFPRYDVENDLGGTRINENTIHFRLPATDIDSIITEAK